MRATTMLRSRKALAIAAIIVVVGVAGATTAAFALLGGAVPSTAAATYTVPTTHFSTSTPLNVALGTYPAGPSSPGLAVFTASLAPRSTTGEAHVHCDLIVGSPARLIGSAEYASTGANLPSASYQTSTIALTGTFTATPAEVLRLSCTATGVSDGILSNAHILINKVASQSGGV
jgi:hypothetical protein